MSINMGNRAKIKSERVFDYSYERQGLKNIGGIPFGLYSIKTSEERSVTTSPLSHGVKSFAWGYYSWSLHPDDSTDVRNRDGFFIHGSDEFGSAGCIDLKDKDTTLRNYFAGTNLKTCFVLVRYTGIKVTMHEEKTVSPLKSGTLHDIFTQ